ncbi:Transposon Tf2-8 polyprotein [Dictyocoela muelleri]|nr:Transposon Tf2-8 polyprotein [Dictyocoela muelleri]
MLGYVNWFRPFIPNLSSILVPINEKLKEGKITWGNDDTKIIQNVFDRIRNAPILSHIDKNKDVSLYCDSSENALGSILVQGKSIIGIYSHKFNKIELNYGITEK